MRYLLDTDTCSFALRKTHGIRERLGKMNAGHFAVSAVTLAEAWTGCRKTEHEERLLAAWAHLLSPLPVLDFDRRCADHYSTIRAHLELRGAMIGSNDCMIAATALAHDLTLITGNLRELRRVPRLRVEDWTTARSRRVR